MAEQTLDKLASCRKTSFCTNTVADISGSLCVVWILQQDFELTNCNLGIVLFARNPAGRAKPAQSGSMIRLVVTGGNNKHRAASAHGFTGGTDPSLVHDRARA